MLIKPSIVKRESHRKSKFVLDGSSLTTSNAFAVVFNFDFEFAEIPEIAERFSL